MTPRPVLCGALLAGALSLPGCSLTGQEELESWMARERAGVRPQAAPPPLPAPLQPQAYPAPQGADPFDPQRLLQAWRAQEGSRPHPMAAELSRPREPLEAEPLDAIAMIGSIVRRNEATALVRAGGLLYLVRVGNHLGQNHGKVMQITENSIRLREIVQDAAGNPMERAATLQLQEDGQ